MYIYIVIPIIVSFIIPIISTQIIKNAKINGEDFNKKFQIDFNEYYKYSLQKNEEFLQIKDGRLSVKPEYMYVENGIIVDFMKD